METKHHWLRRGSWRLTLLVTLWWVLSLPTPPPPTFAADTSAITVIESRAIPTFPRSITFLLEAESRTAPITKVQLLYGAKPADEMTVVHTQVTPARKVHVRYTLDTRTFYLPVGVELAYQWIIRDGEGNVLESEPQWLTYADDRFDWRERSERGITVYWYQGSEQFGDRLIKTATNTLDRLEQEIGVTVREPIKIYVYANSRDMRATLRSNEVEWVGGEARPSLGLIVGVIAPDDRTEIGRLIPHELSHQVLHQATDNPYGGLPIWFNEGLAVYNQETVEASFDLYLDLAARQGRLIPLEALSANFPTDPEQAYLSYAQSYRIVAYLIETYGREAMHKLVKAFAQATPLDQALQDAIGLNVKQLDEEWRKTLPEAVRVVPPLTRRERPAPADRFSGGPAMTTPGTGTSREARYGEVLPDSRIPPPDDMHSPQLPTPSAPKRPRVWVTMTANLVECAGCICVVTLGILLLVVLLLVRKGGR